MIDQRSRQPFPVPPSAFKGFRFPAEVIVLGVRWYLRFGLSYRDVEELLAERGIEVASIIRHAGSARAPELKRLLASSGDLER